jgi:hypothetical protein
VRWLGGDSVSGMGGLRRLGSTLPTLDGRRKLALGSLVISKQTEECKYFCNDSPWSIVSESLYQILEAPEFPHSKRSPYVLMLYLNVHPVPGSNRYNRQRARRSIPTLSQSSIQTQTMPAARSSSRYRCRHLILTHCFSRTQPI